MTDAFGLYCRTISIIGDDAAPLSTFILVPYGLFCFSLLHTY